MKPGLFQHPLLIILISWLKKILIGAGILLLLSISLSFTDYPFWAYFWLGTHNTELEMDPELIVLMGGGGMPSPDGFMRCYSAAELAKVYPLAPIIIAVPRDTARKENSPELLMCHELKIRGVDTTRVIFEPEGMNTRTQALNIKALLADSLLGCTPTSIITSPEHMYRSVASFRKLGFEMVGGLPSFASDLDERILKKKKKDGSKDEDEQMQALGIRYNMWNYMKYEITVMRELCAIGYYKLRGWI